MLIEGRPRRLPEEQGPGCERGKFAAKLHKYFSGKKGKFDDFFFRLFTFWLKNANVMAAADLG